MKFKVGDRVRVYMGHYADETGSHSDAEVIAISQSGGIKVNGDWNGWYHPKQCRKLVKKKRRSVWIKEDQIGNESIYDGDITFDLNDQVIKSYHHEWIEFREVKKK